MWIAARRGVATACLLALSAFATGGIVACADAVGPEPVSVQFEGSFSRGTAPATAISEAPFGLIRVVGGYYDCGCGPIGASAIRRGSVVELEIGPRTDQCDLIRTAYAYDATLVGLAAGSYRLRVYHRPSKAERVLAMDTVVAVLY